MITIVIINDDCRQMAILCDKCYKALHSTAILLWCNKTFIKAKNMENVHYYTVDLNWENDRKGLMTSPVLQSSIEVATPPEFAKGMPGIWSPEHLLVAAVNSCLMTTFLAIAENSKLNFENFESHANGKLEMIDGKFMISEITLSPILTINNETDQERAQRILEKSEKACLISNSVKSKIIFQPIIKLVQNSSQLLQN